VSEGASEHRNLTKRGSSREKKNPHKKVVYAIYIHHPNKDAAAEICNKPKSNNTGERERERERERARIKKTTHT
jgi:hypothetical protein